MRYLLLLISSKYSFIDILRNKIIKTEKIEKIELKKENVYFKLYLNSLHFLIGRFHVNTEAFYAFSLQGS